MNRSLSLTVVALVAVAAVACQPGVAGLTDQDKAAIGKLCDDAAVMMTQAKPDWAAYVQHYYAEDATVLAPNMPPVKGRAAIQAVLGSYPPIASVKFSPVDIDGRGDLAYVRGNYEMTMTVPGAAPVVDRGKYLEVHKRQADGAFKVVYDSWSSDLPLPGLVIPTSAMAADASPEVKQFAGVVGAWRFDGTFKADPAAAASPVDLAYRCGWFSGGYQVVCHMAGTILGGPYGELTTHFYDPLAKEYIFDSIVSDGSRGVGKTALQPGVWIHTGDATVGGKPAKMKWTLNDMSAGGGTWKYEVSVAGGPWVTTGEGKFSAVK